MKVGGLYRMRRGQQASAVPFIRLSGKWLEQAGFLVGGAIHVEVTPGSIRLTVASDREKSR